MATGLIGAIILWLIVAIIVIAVGAWLLNWLYHRSTKEVAFVRTGFGGETVVIDGGAFVLPIVHQVTPVNLNVVRIPIARVRDEAVITRDRMRVDIEAEFFVRVLQEPKAVAAAASTLGRRTLEFERLADLLAGKFVGALRSAATEMSLDEIHEQRSDFVSAVGIRAAEALARNGLELESVAITGLDQTNLEFFNPSNRFDAEGLTRLIEEIETRRKARNDIEQSAMVAIRARNLEAEKQTLKVEQEGETARLDQERALEALRAGQRSAIVRDQVAREAEAQRARITSERETAEHEIARRRSVEGAEIRVQEELETSRIAQQQAIEQARIDQQQSVEQARIAQQQAVERARLDHETALRSEQIRQRHEIEVAETGANEAVERARVVSERRVREARIVAEEETERQEITRGEQLETARAAAGQAIETARVEAHQEVEVVRIAEEQALDRARIERDRRLRSQQISQRQSIEEAEVAAQEEIERARIASERGLDEARVLRERDRKRLEIESGRVLEVAEVERRIALREKEAEEARARVATETARAQAVAAEERVATTRETEVAERVAAVDRLFAAKDAEIARVAAETDKISAAVAAEGERLRNEAANVLNEDARAAMLRSRLIDRLEGIVRESVRPMEKIDGIRILHVEGLGGSGGGEGARSPTDEVIQSALRYRAQAPLIDGMMREIGVEGSNVAGMGDLFRSARDAQSIAREAKKKDEAT